MDLWDYSLLFATEKSSFSETRAKTQQVLPVQTGLYWYDEWMVQEINNKNVNFNLTKVNLVP